MATLVKFRKQIADYVIDITAVFPQLKYNKGLYGNNILTCYSHVGQHSSASIGWMDEDTSPATETEYLPLKMELESIGYNLKICK